MDIGELVIKWAPYFIIILIGIILFIFLYDQLTGANIVKDILCSLFFEVPFGPIFTSLTNACNVIPA